MQDLIAFSNKKLPMSEFTKRYWKDGKGAYQFHDIPVNCGRNELEQLIINDVNANHHMIERYKVDVKSLYERINGMYIFAMISSAFGCLGLLVALLSLWR